MIEVMAQEAIEDTPASLRSPQDDAGAWAEALFDLTSAKPYTSDEWEDLREQFLRAGYVRMPKFLSESALKFLSYELRRLELDASRRVFEMPGYRSPRSLSVVGGRTIKEKSPFLYRLYNHSALRDCVSRIAGRTIYSCQHPEEFMVANFLQCSGDTHGWHLDDPAYALVVFVDAPKEGEGGEVEMVPNWVSLCERHGRSPDDDISDLLEWARKNNLIERRHHEVGDAYLLRADVNLHRVMPLLAKGARRCVINLAFQAMADTAYANTADLLYGEAQDQNRAA